MHGREYDWKDLVTTVDDTVLSLVGQRNVQQVAETISRDLQRVVIIEDRFLRLIGKAPLEMVDPVSSKTQLNDPLVQKYVQKVQSEKVPLIMPPLPQYGVRQSRIVFPVLAGRLIFGFLQVFDKHDPPVFSDHEKGYLKQALTALAIKMLMEEAAGQAQASIMRGLYRKLFMRQYTDLKAVVEAASVLGLDLSVPAWLLLARVDGPGLPQEKQAALRSFVLELAPEAVSVALPADISLIVIPEGDQRRKKVVIMSLAHQILESFRQYQAELVVHVALGRKCLSPGDYPVSYQEALKALDYLRECSPASQVLSFDCLGELGLVSLTEEVEQLLAFSRRTLAPLLENDAQNPSMKLVQTLDCFLKNNAQLKQTARELFIHVNTLRYRLEKIRELGGFDLENAEVKFRLFLALKILHLRETLTHRG